MTHERDVERLLDTWFSDGPTKAPDRVMDAVADRIARQPQRPAWRLTWRNTPLNAYLKPLVAVAATILIAVVGFNMLGGPRTNSNVAAPNPSPSATASPTPTPSPSPASTPEPTSTPVASEDPYACDPDRTCSGLLPAGDHTSGSFSVPFTFTTPAGWVNRVDIPRAYRMDTDAGIAPQITVMSKIAIAEQNAACDPIAKAGAGNSVQDIVDFLGAHPGLDTTKPVPVTVGGYKGQSIDIAVAKTWTATCPDKIGPFVLLLTDTETPAGRALGYESFETARWDIIDVNGETVIIARLHGSADGLLDQAAAAAQPIIDSIKFTKTN